MKGAPFRWTAISQRPLGELKPQFNRKGNRKGGLFRLGPGPISLSLASSQRRWPGDIAQRLF
jgi:hypothetical protein